MPTTRTRAVTGLAALVAAVVATGLSGCVPGPPPLEREPFTGEATPMDTAGFDGRSIDYVYFADSDAEERATRDLIADFEAETGAEVNLQVVPYVNLEQSLNARLSGSDVPDVARVSSNQLTSFTDQTTDLRHWLGADYLDEFQEGIASTVTGDDGEVWAVPSDLTMNGLFVNVEQFEAAGVPLPTADDPWSWDELVATARQVQAAVGSEFALAVDKSGHRVSGVLSGYGTTMIGEDGGNGLDPSVARDVIAGFAELMADETMSRDFWLSSGSRYAGANEIFLAESAPVYLSGNWQVAQFAGSADFEWAVVPNACDVRCGGFPGGKVMTVFERGGDADLAAAFVAWMNDTEQQRRMDAAANFLPTRVDLAEEGVDYGVRDADMAVFLDEVGRLPLDTYASAKSPQFNQASLDLVDQIARVVGGDTTPDDAARALEGSIDGLVGGTAR